LRGVATAPNFAGSPKTIPPADPPPAVPRKPPPGPPPRQSAVAAIVRRTYEPRLNGVQANFLNDLLSFKIESRDRAARFPRHNRQRLARAQGVSRRAQQQNRVARLFEPLRCCETRVFD